MSIGERSTGRQRTTSPGRRPPPRPRARPPPRRPGPPPGAARSRSSAGWSSTPPCGCSRPTATTARRSSGWRVRPAPPAPASTSCSTGKDDLFAAVVEDAAERVVATSREGFRGLEDLPLRDFARHSFAVVFDMVERDGDAVTVLLNAERGGIEPPMASVAETRRRVLDEINRHTARPRWADYGIEVGSASDMLSLMYFGMGEVVAIRQADDPGGTARPHRPAHRVHGRRALPAGPAPRGPGGRQPPRPRRRPRRRLRADRARCPAPPPVGGPPGPSAAPLPPPGTAAVVVAGGPLGTEADDRERAAEVAAAALRGLPGDAWVVAADSGFDRARALGLRVDQVVGDMDSVSPDALGRRHRRRHRRASSRGQGRHRPRPGGRRRRWPPGRVGWWSSGRPGAASTTCSP